MMTVSDELMVLRKLIEQENIDLSVCGLGNTDEDLICFALRYVMSNSDHAFEEGYPEKDGETENKTDVIDGHLIEYWYGDGWDGEMDETDILHVARLLADGYVEGELTTTDTNVDWEYHGGWWKKIS